MTVQKTVVLNRPSEEVPVAESPPAPPPPPPPPSQDVPAAQSVPPPAPSLPPPSAAEPAQRRPVSAYQTRDDATEERPARVGKVQWPPQPPVDSPKSEVAVGRLEIEQSEDLARPSDEVVRQRIEEKLIAGPRSPASTQPVCIVTTVVFLGHINRSFYLLSYLLTYSQHTICMLCIIFFIAVSLVLFFGCC